MGSKLSDQINSDVNNDTNKKTYCYVCNIVVNFTIHEKEIEHLLKMDYFSKSFIKNSENLVECKVCSKVVMINDVNKHAIQHKLIPWHQREDEFQQYFMNFITLNNDTYWCYLCQKEFKYWFQAISHFTVPEHLLHMNEIDKNIVNMSFPLGFYEKCVLHSIFPFSVDKIKCFICNCIVNKYENIEDHISSKNHNELRSDLRQTDNILLPQITTNNASRLSVKEFYFEYFKNFIGILQEKKHVCYLCDEQFSNRDVAMHHIKSSKHQSALITLIDDKNIDTSLSLNFYKKCLQHNIFPTSLNKLICFICDCYIPGYKNIDKHISRKFHRDSKENLSSLQRSAEDSFFLFFKNFIGIVEKMYRCYVCAEFFSNEHKAITHIQNSNHKLLLNNPIYTISNVNFLSEYKFFIKESIFSTSVDKLKCFMCNVPLSGYLTAKQHIMDKQHSQNYILCKSDGQFSLSKNCNNESNSRCRSTEDNIKCFINFIGFIGNQYWCFLCNQKYNNCKDAIIHTQSSNHQGKITKGLVVNSNLSRKFYEYCIHQGIFAVSFNKVKCSICEQSFTYSNAIEHPKTKCHTKNISVFQSQIDTLSLTVTTTNKKKTKDFNGKYNLCFMNFIGILKKIYWCFICHEKYNHWDLTVAHIQSLKHRSNVIDLINIKDIKIKLSSTFYQNCVQQGIFPKSFNSLKCFICESNTSYSNTNGHLNSIRHKKKFLAWKIPLNDEYSEEKSINSSKNSDGDRNDSIDKNDVPETEKAIINSNSIDKVMTALESRALKNKTLHTEVSTLNSTQNKSIRKKKNKIDNSSILVDSINNQVKMENLSSQATDSQLESPKKLLNNHKKATLKTTKRQCKLNKLSRQQINSYRKFLFCIICKKTFKSERVLHIHLTSHFWSRFIQQNDCQEMPLKLPDNNCQLNHNLNHIESVDIEPYPSTSNTYENNTSLLKKSLDNTTHITRISNQVSNANSLDIQMEVTNVSNLNTKISNQEEKHEKVKTNGSSKSKDFKSYKINTNHRSGPLTAQKKFKNNKYLLKTADIEPDKKRKIDVYKIDQTQLKMMNLSKIQSCFLDDEKIYCLICREKISNSVDTVLEHFRSIHHNDYLLEMIQDHVKFMSFPDQLSDLSLAREWMEDISDELVECYACQKKIVNNISSLKEHLSEKSHVEQIAQVASKMDKLFESLYLRMERNWYKVRRYWCVPCHKNYLLENDFYEHIYASDDKKSKHMQQCKKFSKFTNFILDYCPTCTTLFYGFRDTFSYHCEIEKHKYFQEKPFYIVDKLPLVVENMLPKLDLVINEMIELLNAKAQQRQENEKLIINDLEMSVNNLMTAKAYAFGSRVTELSSESSDLDIFLDYGDRYYQGKKTDDISDILKQVENSLRNYSKIWQINRVITACNVPIIKVIHKPLGIECDISFLNGLTTECSQLIKTIIQKFPLCRKLILFVKQWINMCNLSGEQGISSYGVTWMVIYYLQTELLIKTIATLIEEQNKSKMVGGWEVGANLDFSIPESNKSFRDLLKGFFEMLMTFDFRNNIICPLLGKPLEKIRFSDAERLLPEEMDTYKKNHKQEDYDLFRIDSPLCIQDPYDLSHNITKATKKYIVSKLITFSTLTVKKLHHDDVFLY